jgi:hypothetical protein
MVSTPSPPDSRLRGEDGGRSNDCQECEQPDGNNSCRRQTSGGAVTGRSANALACCGACEALE